MIPMAMLTTNFNKVNHLHLVYDRTDIPPDDILDFKQAGRRVPYYIYNHP